MAESEEFGAEVRLVLAARRLSLRGASIKTGLARNTIMSMAQGKVPYKPTIYTWAAAIGEPVNKWLALAGYDLLPDVPSIRESIPTSRSASEKVESPVPPNMTPSVSIPASLHAAIASADSNAEKVRIAFEYIWLRGDDLGIGAVGSSEGGSNQYQARLQVVRAIEQHLGIRLLPPEVV